MVNFRLLCLGNSGDVVIDRQCNVTRKMSGGCQIESKHCLLQHRQEF